MNKKDVVNLVTFAIIGLLLVSSVLIPIVVSGTTEKVVNENTFNKIRYSKESSVEISVAESTINGEPVTGNGWDSGTFLFSDTFMVGMYFNGDTVTWMYPSLDVDPDTNQTIIYELTDIELQNGSYKFTYADGVLEGIYSFLMVPDVNGDYCSTTSYSDYYVDSKVEEIYGIATTSANYGVSVGTLDMMVTKFHVLNKIVDTDSHLTTVTYTPVNEGISTIYKITASNSMIVAPLEYVYTEEKTGITTTILSVLPIFVVVGILIAVVPRRE